ncbi:uncharacterized protein LOC116349109 [Contarinia nasturtii]|uniref:uncharacterized protein LOC116349109 n=1 Tax=Contarinia nasturtii TaxID=265458 RepID=UPI0012D43D96|nr:uncharacterized protein LOC116349109 [Contarinia nasturtii]
MKFIIVLCVVALALVASAMKSGSSRKKSIVVPMPSSLSSVVSMSPLSGLIRMVDANINPENVREAATKYKGTTWMKKCCGVHVINYGNMIKQLKSTIPKKDDNFSFLNDVIESVNGTVEHFTTLYNGDEYAENWLNFDVREMEKNADELRELFNNTNLSKTAKEMIERICIDIHTVVCWLKGSRGPYPPMILPNMGANVVN